MSLLWMVKHKRSGGFLPQTEHGQHTKAELVTAGVPRLFESEKDANRSLGQWLRGVATLRWNPGVESSPYGSPPEDYCDMEIEPRPDRKRAEMQVVPVKVVEAPSFEDVVRDVQANSLSVPGYE